MKFFKYALLSVRSNLLINLMMIAEITAVLLGANLMVGGYNNRNMLKKPYGEILEKNGWYVVCEMGDRNELVIPDDLHGDLKIITMDNYMFAVIIIGFISCTSINTLKQMKNFGTLFICGMDWGSCLTICCAYTIIIISCSAIVTAAVYAVGKAMNISASLGLAFELNNVLITAAIIGLLFLLNMIIPVFIINHRSPVEIIKEGSL